MSMSDLEKRVEACPFCGCKMREVKGFVTGDPDHNAECPFFAKYERSWVKIDQWNRRALLAPREKRCSCREHTGGMEPWRDPACPVHGASREEPGLRERGLARMLEVVAANLGGLALVLRGEGSPEHSEDLRAQVDEIRNVIAALAARPVEGEKK